MAQRIVRYLSLHAPLDRFGDPTSEVFDEWGLRDAAQFLAEGLQARNFKVTRPKNREDWAYDFEVEDSAAKAEVIVASTDDEHPLVVSIEGVLGWLARRSPERRAATEALVSATCQAIDGVVRSDHQISKIRWWTEAAWSTGEGYTEHPQVGSSTSVRR